MGTYVFISISKKKKMYANMTIISSHINEKGEMINGEMKKTFHYKIHGDKNIVQKF